ncbi:MAG: hypothetical protein DCF19_07395 [Pseudanabaena frigida]|uniref:Uncharacterized protein n=1 Tax=Pseudanabaena frigida TaxID=945775 RepID=A0A2W4Y642_9CYAN|nr:MAG: hypothetical protein DCF19_07395 [Pseudanabaena frigida]
MIIQTESAYLKILNFNTNLKTLFTDKWLATTKYFYLLIASHLFLYIFEVLYFMKSTHLQLLRIQANFFS